MKDGHELGSPADLGLMQASRMLSSGAVSALDLTEAALARIEATDASLKSYMIVAGERALSKARALDAERAAGQVRGPLHGVPVAVKDLCRTEWAPTSAGMSIHKDYMAEADATVCVRLEQAGAIILGKLAMTEGAFAHHHPLLQTPVNPWGERTWTGASSSGSGSSVAAGQCFASLGSDTGGSIRFPSAACGVTGLKPTWGRVSRAGVFALADSLDHVGPMARAAEDCAAMMTALAGADPRDPTTLDAPTPDYLAGLSTPVSGLRIGFDEALVMGAVSPATAAALTDALEAFRALGARIVPVTLPDDAGMFDDWNAICAAECAVAHAETWPAKKAHYGPIGALIEAGHAVTGLELARAMQNRLIYVGALNRSLMDVDMVLMPVLTGDTPTIPDFMAMVEGGIEALLKFTAPADMAGLPALTFPAGFDAKGAPIGLQLMGPALSEPALLSAGHAFQTVTGWHTRRPDLSPFTA
ncbi:MAG: amidase [Pikeienuella sp.]|uniref:amidase n=1 Tax=Pikeienuella sp. TaxID=2831957 RepID=UPI00391A82BC